MLTLLWLFAMQLVCPSVRAQPVLVECRTALDCSSPSNVTTLEECCLGDGNLAFTVPSIDRCNPCIVFGWTQDSFSRAEQGSGYTLNVSFIKGAAQAATNLEFNVNAISGTAKEGPSNDYTLQTTTGVRLFYLRPTIVHTVSFSFHADGIAQEPNETLSFELVPASDNQLFMQEGVIFKNIVNLTIVDSDSVSISFSEGDYSTTELVNGVPGVLNVMVTKTSRIASPVTLTVTPLTVKTAMDSGGPLPSAIPQDNPFSPNRAGYEDFNNTVITITFDTDEDGSSANNNQLFPISVVDDDINEATEQVFVVQLKLNSSVNSDSVVLTQAASLCIIRDNDDMRIGFVQPEYSYIEPEAETVIDSSFEPQADKSGPVFLQKEGGVVTEQTFRIAVSTTSTVPSGRDIQPATLGEDYRLSVAGGTSVITIPPNQEMVNFEFTLFSDDLDEGTEAFQASSSPDTTPVTIDGVTHAVPSYLPPRVLTGQSFIIISDDDFTEPLDFITCRIFEPLQVEPFTHDNRYNFMGTCEYVAFSSCDDLGSEISVTVDFLTESMENGAVGLHVGSESWISRENGEIDQGQLDSDSPYFVEVLEDVDRTNLSFSVVDTVAAGFDLAFQIIHIWEGDSPSIEINVRIPMGSPLESCGLCGTQLGVLSQRDGTIATIGNMQKVETFVQSYLVPPKDQSLRPQRRECGTIKNDTVIGDPLYTVPLLTTRDYSLCYEVFGRTNSTLNLISDTCVSVNALYGPMDDPVLGNIIKTVGVKVVGQQENKCYNIRVDLDQCSASVNGGDELGVMQRFEEDGVTVRKYAKRVRISAPNCDNVMLVVWIICENHNSQDMIKFVVARGVNLRPSSHGLLGQFWNIPVMHEPFSGSGLGSGAEPDYYVVTVTPENSPPRRFLAELVGRTWDKTKTPCLYAGNSQGGPSYEVDDPNDSIIEGKYRDYIIVDEKDPLFKTEFKHSRFEKNKC